MNQLLSDRRTLWYKIGPVLGAGALLVVLTLVRPRIPTPPDLPPPPIDPSGVLAIVINVVAWAVWGVGLYAAWRLKTVAVEGDRLIIGGLRRTVAVPLHQVEEVTPIIFGHFGRIDLHQETGFGGSIWFLPAGPRAGLFQPARSILELRAAVGERRGDSSTLPVPPTDLTAAWRRLRRWRLAHTATFVVEFVAFPFLLSKFATATIGGFPAPLVLFLPVGLIWIISGNVIQHWPCPGCGQRFFSTRWGFPLPAFMTSACRHCGLRKGEGARS